MKTLLSVKLEIGSKLPPRGGAERLGRAVGSKIINAEQAG